MCRWILRLPENREPVSWPRRLSFEAGALWYNFNSKGSNSMKQRFSLIGLAGLVVAGLTLFGARALSAAEEAKVTLQGTVSVTEDDDGNIEAVSLTVPAGDSKGKYTVVLDAQGKKLGNDAAYAEAKVTGTVTKKGADLTLKVISFQVVEQEEGGGGDEGGEE